MFTSAFEESVESFITQWRPYAADVTLFAHTEGSPLLECRAAGVIFSVMERTGPYSAETGPAKLILHLTTEQIEGSDEPLRKLAVLGPSHLKAWGLVVLRQGRMVVVDAGAPLVVGSFAPLPDTLAAGDWVTLTGLPPVHGFLLAKASRTVLAPAHSEI